MAYSIKNLVLKRENGKVSASWGVSGATAGEYSDGWFDEQFTFNASNNMSRAVTYVYGESSDTTGDIVYHYNYAGFHNSASNDYNRSKYHPLTKGRRLTSVTCKVLHDTEPLSEGTYKSLSATISLTKPDAPTIPEPSYDSSVGRVTFTVDAAESTEKGERYDTMYRVLRQDSANRNNSFKSEKAVINWAAFTENSKNDIVYGIWDDQVLAIGQWVKVTCQAYSRGLAGDSSTKSRVFLYAWPAQAVIKSIVASGLGGTDVVSVRINTNMSEYAPVDTTKLQRLYNTTITSAVEAGLASGWQDVSGAVDTGGCNGFSDQVSAALPDVKKHTWYRVVTTHGAYSRYSEAVEATCLYRANSPQSDDEVLFVKAEPGVDGKSALCRLAWKNDDSNTTQISWSEYEDAWESTEQPKSSDITWEDSTDIPSGWNHAATVTIRGLAEATEYYIRSRRALIQSDSSSYGPWCYPPDGKYPISTATAPSDVVLVAPATVERGSGIDCSWTFSGSEQTAWEIRYMDDGVEKVIAYGDGPAGATVIPASALEGMDSIDISVSVTAGGEWASSEYVSVTIDDRPTLSMAVAGTLTAQPVSIVLTCDNPRTDVTVYITSNGVVSMMPDGNAIQADGDVVWAEAVHPIWAASGDSWTATVTPPTLKLYNTASYLVSAVATDTSTFLSSDAVVSEFTVDWAHKAVSPSDETTITVNGLTATITPMTPESGYESGDGPDLDDVVDVYRNTPDGAYLIARDVPFGQAVTDRFAPYSSRAELSYILCTRTEDGDIDWNEYGYELRHGTLRIDFGTQSVELPFNINMSDSWEKGFELREHLDGTRAGYWNEGATRKASLSTDVVKVQSAEQRRLLAELAKYAGACFVRTPDGCAYPADVEVDSYGVTYDSAAVPVSIAATEVAMTDEFRIAPSDWVMEEEDNGGGTV